MKTPTTITYTPSEIKKLLIRDAESRFRAMGVSLPGPPVVTPDPATTITTAFKIITVTAAEDAVEPKTASIPKRFEEPEIDLGYTVLLGPITEKGADICERYGYIMTVALGGAGRWLLQAKRSLVRGLCGSKDKVIKGPRRVRVQFPLEKDVNDPNRMWRVLAVHERSTENPDYKEWRKIITDVLNR